MAIGLSRNKNLSEKNLNLKDSLQKLYAPGIEEDIRLFSLSSSIESSVVSGPEVNEIGGRSQIFSIANEKLKLSDGTLVSRSKFITKYYTFTNENKVYLKSFGITLGSSSDVTLPKFSNNGSIPKTKIVTSGRGYYFLNAAEEVFDAGDEITIKNVVLEGRDSGSSTARATVTFSKEPDPSGNTDYLTNFTPASTKRYSISSIVITEDGSGYLIPEKLKVKEGSVKNNADDTNLILKKQEGEEFAYTDPLIFSDLFYYTVKDATDDYFFLYDDEDKKYLFIDNATTSLSLKQIDIRRYDGIVIENFTPFKFAQSTIYLNGYSNPYRLEDSISGEINSLSGNISFIDERKEKAIQNTKRPTSTTSEENILGYTYNSFVGDDVVIWQRLILRDQDFLIDPSDSDITGDALKSDVTNFSLTKSDESEIRVPGLFIKVGNEYFRAFSTTDKPFLADGNPNDDGVLSAESLFDSSWYAYNSTISKLGQRIDPNGTNGAFYFHRDNNPDISQVSVKKNGVDSTIYSVSLFTLVA